MGQTSCGPSNQTIMSSPDPPARYKGAGNVCAPQVGDQWVNPDGSAIQTYTYSGWVAGGASSVQASTSTQTGAAIATATLATMGTPSTVVGSVSTAAASVPATDPITAFFSSLTSSDFLVMGGIVAVLLLLNSEGGGQVKGRH